MTSSQENPTFDHASTAEKSLVELAHEGDAQRRPTREVNQFKKISKLSLVLIFTIAILISLIVFLGFQLNATRNKVNALEETTQKNTRQLMNLNEILGNSLDLPKDQSEAIPPLSMKYSLEFFKHLNKLIGEVESLSFAPTKDPTLLEKKIPTAVLREDKKALLPNSEIRWWSMVINNIFNPVKNYFYELVQIQVIDTPVTELAMTKQSQAMLRKEITLRLITTRQMVLNGMAQEAITETKLIHSIAAKNLNPADQQVAKFLNDLDQLVIDLEKSSTQTIPNPLKEK